MYSIVVLFFLSLFLCRALGQGAFGEVYQGYLRHVAGDSVEMPVAVKVLQVNILLFKLLLFSS